MNIGISRIPILGSGIQMIEVKGYIRESLFIAGILTLMLFLLIGSLYYWHWMVYATMPVYLAGIEISPTVGWSYIENDERQMGFALWALSIAFCIGVMMLLVAK